MIKKWLQHGQLIAQRTWIFVLSSVFGDGLNYVYHLLLTYYLLPAQYGLIQTLGSLTYFWIVLIGTLRISTTELLAQAEQGQILALIKLTLKRHAKIAVVAGVGLAAAYWPLTSFLSINNGWLYFLFAAQMLLMLFSLVLSSALRAQLKFNLNGVVNIFAGLVKIGFFLIPVMLLNFTPGSKPLLLLSQGAKLGYQLTVAALFVLFLVWLQRSAAADSSLDHKLQQPAAEVVRNPFIRGLSLNMVINLATTSIFNSDLLLVRRFFSQEQSGKYAFASTLGKIIYFSSIMILSLTFPLVAKYQNQPKKFRKYVLLGSVLMAGFNGTMTLVYVLKPDLILQLLNTNFQQISYLGLYALFISLAALFNYFVKLLLVLSKRTAALTAALIALLQIGLIAVNHNSVQQVLLSSILALGFGLIVSLPLMLKQLNYDRKKS